MVDLGGVLGGLGEDFGGILGHGWKGKNPWFSFSFLLILGCFGGPLDTRGFWKCQFFWFLIDFVFFDFLGFWAV